MRQRDRGAVIQKDKETEREREGYLLYIKRDREKKGDRETEGQ